MSGIVFDPDDDGTVFASPPAETPREGPPDVERLTRVMRDFVNHRSVLHRAKWCRMCDDYANDLRSALRATAPRGAPGEPSEEAYKAAHAVLEPRTKGEVSLIERAVRAAFAARSASGEAVQLMDAIEGLKSVARDFCHWGSFKKFDDEMRLHRAIKAVDRAAYTVDRR